MTKLILVGAGSHAVSAVDLVESTGRYSIVGVLEDRIEKGGSFLDYFCLGDFASASDFIAEWPSFLISVGQIGEPGIRESLFGQLISHGGLPATVVSPQAYVSPRSSLGAGTAVFHGAVVNAEANIGENCIINSQALVEHDAIVGSHSHIATGARVNGGVTLGSRCFVGSGAVIFQGCEIPSGGIIPAGALVKSWPVS